MTQVVRKMHSDERLELVLSHSAWETALRTLLTEPDRYAIGRVRWNVTLEGVEWLVDDVEIVNQLPQGRDRLALMDWIVLSLQSTTATSAARLLSQMELRKSQTVISVVFDRTQRGRWEGAVHREGVVQPLDGLQIVGPRMLKMDRAPEQPPEIPLDGRWSRTAGALGVDLWRKVSTAHMLLIGCGRNGTQAAWQLAGLGVQRFTLVDGDSLEPSNLDAMPGVSVEDIGQPKVSALARRLIEFNPDLLIHCFQTPINDVLNRLRKRYQLIVSCVDSDVPRLAASWLARELLVPHLDIGTAIHRDPNRQLELAGDARLLLPFEGCVQCVGGIVNREETLYEFAAPSGSLKRGEPQAWNQQRVGSLVHLNALTVGAALELWLGLLRGAQGAYWQRIACDPDGEWRLTGRTVSASDECLFCQAAQKS